MQRGEIKTAYTESQAVSPFAAFGFAVSAFASSLVGTPIPPITKTSVMRPGQHLNNWFLATVGSQSNPRFTGDLHSVTVIVWQTRQPPSELRISFEIVLI
jgi:hypothetical protein